MKISSILLLIPLLFQNFLTLSQPTFKFSDIYLPVKENNLWGYIDKAGKVIIKPQFQFVGKFGEDGFAIAQKNDKLGFIDEKGKTVVPFKYTEIKYLRSDIFAIKAEKWGLFHKTKGQILPSEYDSIHAIYLKNGYNIIQQIILCKKNDKVGVVDIEGKILVSPKYDNFLFYSKGKKDFLVSYNDHKQGLIHLKRGEIIPAKYDKISLLAFEYIKVYEDQQVGLYNNLGEQIIPCNYEGLQFYNPAKEKFILLNKKAYKSIYNIPQKRMIISAENEFTNIRDVVSNDTTFKIFQVKNLKGTTAIDENGLQLLPIGDYTRFKHDKAGIIYLEKDKVWGVYFQKNKRLLKPQFQEISNFVSNLALVAKNSRWGIINIHGDILVEPLYKKNQFRITRNSIRIYGQNGVENLILDENKKIIDRFRLKKLRSIKVKDMPDFKFDLNTEEDSIDVFENIRRNNNQNDVLGPPIMIRRSNNRPPVRGERITQIPMGNRVWQYLDREKGWKLYDSTRRDYITRTYVSIEVNEDLGLSKAVISIKDKEEIGHIYRNERAELLIKGAFKVNQVMRDFEQGKVTRLEAKYSWNRDDSLSVFQKSGIYYEYLHKGGQRQDKVTFLKNGKTQKTETITNNLAFENNFSKFQIKNTDNWGFINRQGQVVVEPKHQILEYPNETGLIKFGKGKKLGIIDTLNKEVLPKKYKNIDFIKEYELMIAKKGRKYGLYRYNGTELLATKYDLIDKKFSRGFTTIIQKNKHGIIDNEGKIVIPPKYDEILNFDAQGFARIRIDDKWGLVNQKAEVIIEPTYHKIEMFDFKGFAKVRMQKSEKGNTTWNIGIIDKTGREIVAPIQDSVAYLNDCEYTAFRTINALDKENFGVIDKTGKLLVPYQFQNIRLFHDNIAAAERNRYWGFIDTTGNYVIQPIYTSVNDFKEGIARVSDRRKYGYVNTQGKLIVSCELSYAEDAEGGICRVRKNEKYGILSTQGSWIIEPKYDKILPFDEEAQAMVTIKDKKDFYYGIINKEGKEIIPCKYQELGAFQQGVAKVRINDTYNFIDRKGNYIFKEFYEDILGLHEGLLGVKKGGKWGFIDIQGNMSIKPQYNEVHSFMNGFARVITSKRKLIYIDKNAKAYKKLPKDVVWFNQDSYIQVKPFQEGLAAVQLKSGKWLYITNTGKKPFAGIFLEASSFYNGYAKVKAKDKKDYYIDKQGKRYLNVPVVWQDEEKEAKAKKIKQNQLTKHQVQTQTNLKPVIISKTFKKNDLYGVVNQYGFTEINPKYNFLSGESESKRIARKNFLYGVTNIQGTQIATPNCELIQYLGEDIFRIEEGDKIGYWNYKKGWIWEMKK